MESYLTLLARLVVLAFVAIVVAKTIMPTATRAGNALSGTPAEQSNPTVEDTPGRIDNNLVLSGMIGIAVFSLSAIGLCWFEVSRLQNAIKKTTDLGGKVHFSPDFTFPAFRWLYSKTTLDLSGSKLTDDTMPNIWVYSRLESLRVGSTSITEKFSDTISRCRHLKSLDISDSQLGDDFVKSALKKHLQIETLLASQTPITDSSIECISESMHLQKLECVETAITPEGLRRLTQLRPDLTIIS